MSPAQQRLSDLPAKLGVAPNLVHLAQGFIRQTPDVPGTLFHAGVAIFFGLGAMVAVIFAETDARKAFFLGISLPAFIATAQTQGFPRPAQLLAQARPKPAPRHNHSADPC